jgi:hypothetical protein
LEIEVREQAQQDEAVDAKQDTKKAREMTVRQEDRDQVDQVEQELPLSTKKQRLSVAS